MTLLFVDGFDAKDVTSKWITTLTAPHDPPTYTSSTRLGAGYAMQVPGTGNFDSFYYLTRMFTASSHVFIGAAVKTEFTSGLSLPFFILGTDAAATYHLYVFVTSVGALELWRGNGKLFPYSGTKIAQSANGAVGSSWHYIELGATIDSSTGTAVVKIDGTQVISFTGNTRNGGTSTDIDNVVHYGNYNNAFGIRMASNVIDDLYVCNSSGSTNNTFLGDVRVQTLLPTGAGSSTALTPTGSGSNYVNVSEVPDDPATYNGSGTVGARDTYALPNLLAATSTVLGVQQVTAAFKTESGTAGLKAAQKSGATVSYGSTRSLGTSPSTYLDLFQDNPATSAPYTVSEVNALEAGAEVA